jgi:hypothetical protein
LEGYSSTIELQARSKKYHYAEFAFFLQETVAKLPASEKLMILKHLDRTGFAGSCGEDILDE